VPAEGECLPGFDYRYQKGLSRDSEQLCEVMCVASHTSLCDVDCVVTTAV